ncbi:hypothetical protein R5R35_005548 [Gryllus longicercus]|uniref:isopentenyl-diphosphate Delta-isomerase n=1 Tax=Gryllus longicercus TaxID=2509291 RepID=A0AAN9VR49_9ORTH
MNFVQRISKFNFCNLGIRHFSVASKTAPQIAALEEQCILVDENDKVVGRASKRDCHSLKANGSLLLHRAFSVFVFNSKNQLLLQRRSSQKITFPDCFTNTCCSHPLYDIPGEREENDALGIRRAAQRRLRHELGIPIEEVSIEDLKYLTRIHYQANNDGGVWGEHEIDYILFLHKDVTLLPNPDEVSEVCYIDRNELDSFINSSVHLTPWFRLIINHNLRLWWDNLSNITNFIDHSKIHKLQ